MIDEDEVSEEELRFAGGFRPSQCPHFLVSPLAVNLMPRGATNVAFRKPNGVGFHNVTDFGAQSHGLSARCPCFAAFLPGFPVVQPRKTRLWGGLPAQDKSIPCS